MTNDSQTATAEQKSSALAYAGPSRIGGLALLDEAGDLCELRVESWLPQPAGVVIDFCLQRQNFIAIMPDRMQVIWSLTESGQLVGLHGHPAVCRSVRPVGGPPNTVGADAEEIQGAAPADGTPAVGHHVRTALQGLVAPGPCF
ncbi:hypothetical protein [Pseudarthrobacter chlorophenolicus]|uniref:hypothetical protein n=1 Tax=Pseudarthrobacter chlorophenolicus TaxID=85085 RepID=UPI0005C18106|nr:hypothetical protein [Pseudarthrobacter chlorophenolicus]